MSMKSAYRAWPAYLAVPAALICSAALAILSGLIFLVLVSMSHVTDDFVDGLFVAFVASPSLALCAFVSCFSFAMRLHHQASWRAPSFAFAFGAALLLLWGHDWLGFNRLGLIAFFPGGVAWLLSCWLLHRKHEAFSEHVLQA
jgi:hypothetical protein